MELVTSEADERRQDESFDSSRIWRHLLTAVTAVPDKHETDAARARNFTTESSIQTGALHDAPETSDEATRQLASGENDFVVDWSYVVPAANATTVLADNERSDEFDESDYNKS